MFAARDQKTASIARAVGYRSEKNFYRALRDVTGKRPTEIRGISDLALRAMTRALEIGFGATATTRGLSSGLNHLETRES
jgi:AraC-like DNA-binding protein